MNVYNLSDFLKETGILLDVRSPGEFAQGRIPGSLNLPLFNDRERALIGTLYKQSGKYPAIEEGLRLVGPKLADFVAFSKRNIPHGIAKVYCWRGGMRSSSMAWLLNIAGIKAVTLQKGYKTFRKWSLQMLEQPRKLKVIGGCTGTGKTAILQELKRRGEQVIDLEKIASHKGSSYGILGIDLQPSNEQFENEIAMQWAAADPTRTLWIEDESHLIGKCKIPDPLFRLMRASPLIFLECSVQERVDHLLQDYGSRDPEELIRATQRISKRLGSARTAEIIHFIREGNLKRAIELTLHYYDSAYKYGLSLRSQKDLIKINRDRCSAEEWANILLNPIGHGHARACYYP